MQLAPPLALTQGDCPFLLNLPSSQASSEFYSFPAWGPSQVFCSHVKTVLVAPNVNWEFSLQSSSEVWATTACLNKHPPWKKSYDKPRQRIKKQIHHLPTKVCILKAMVFPVVVCRCESWTIKKTEQGRIDAFELWCWRRLLRVP